VLTSKTEKGINPFVYNIRKIMWGPDSGMTPTKAAKTIKAKTGIPDISEVKLKFFIRNSTKVKGTKIQRNSLGICSFRM